jgi:AcrR family transcriptional regulator
MSESVEQHTRARNARGEGARLRNEIIAAALSLLQNGPSEAVTLRAVAREAGVTAPSIYRHFRDLDAILRTVVDIAFDDLERVLRAVSPEGEPFDRLRRVCQGYLDFARQHPQRYRLMFGGVWNAEEAAARASEDFAGRPDIGIEAFHVLSDAIAECVAAGQSSSTDPFADAAALWAALHGLADLRRTAPLFPWPADVQDRLVDSLARARR